MNDEIGERRWPASEGEMAARIREFDWLATPLGPVEGWPISLRTSVENMLASRFPKALAWGPELITLHNDAFKPILGEKPLALGRPFSEVWSETWHSLAPIVEDVFEGQATFIEDFPLTINRHGTPEEANFTFCYSPVRDDNGVISGFLDTVIETTRTVENARRIQAANAKLVERETFLSSILAASTDCIKVLDLDGTLTDMSEGGMRVMEIEEFSAVQGCYWPNLLKGEGQRQAIEALAAARAGDTRHFEMAADTFAGTPKWWSVSVSPIRDENGAVVRILSVSRDHTALKTAREQQAILNAELGHRMKNQLAIVQAIVGQTLRSADNLSTAADALSKRIQVLSGAHDILITGGTGKTTVGDIVNKVLALHDDSLVGRFNIEGPNLVVASRPGLSLSLILHELSTNAAKHGALSVPDGFVNVIWPVDRNGEGATFFMEWSEHDGPSVSEPSRRGAGSRLIRAGLAGTEQSAVAVEYAVTGLKCVLVAELSSFQTER